MNSEKQFIFSRKIYFQFIFRFLFVASNNIFGLPGSSYKSIAFTEHKASAAKKQGVNETAVTYLKLYVRYKITNHYLILKKRELIYFLKRHFRSVSTVVQTLL